MNFSIQRFGVAIDINTKMKSDDDNNNENDLLLRLLSDQL